MGSMEPFTMVKHCHHLLFNRASVPQKNVHAIQILFYFGVIFAPTVALTFITTP